MNRKTYFYIWFYYKCIYWTKHWRPLTADARFSFFNDLKKELFCLVRENNCLISCEVKFKINYEHKQILKQQRRYSIVLLLFNLKRVFIFLSTDIVRKWQLLFFVCLRGEQNKALRSRDGFKEFMVLLCLEMSEVLVGGKEQSLKQTKTEIHHKKENKTKRRNTF